jgi:anti-sigma factor RsiW
MTCQELTTFLDDYLAGELPPRVLESFRRHLALCETCRFYLQTYGATIELARAALHERSEEPLEPVPDELVQAILAARAESTDRSS